MQKRLENYPYLAARWPGSPFAAPPTALVIHSGAIADNVAEYLHRCQRKVSAHFSWSGERDAFVQQVDLDREAWHAGGSTIAGQRANGCSIGIELPGPWLQDPRPQEQLDAFQALIGELCTALPSLQYWTRHSDINAGKKDPGPGFNQDFVDVLWLAGLEWVG